jgi:hypothetical protein
MEYAVSSKEYAVSSKEYAERKDMKKINTVRWDRRQETGKPIEKLSRF